MSMFKTKRWWKQEKWRPNRLSRRFRGSRKKTERRDAWKDERKVYWESWKMRMLCNRKRWVRFKIFSRVSWMKRVWRNSIREVRWRFMMAWILQCKWVKGKFIENIVWLIFLMLNQSVSETPWSFSILTS